MEKKRYNFPTLFYVFLNILIGIFSAIFLFIFPSEREWDPWPFFFFGSLTLLATSLSISFQGHLPSKGVIQISASFVYALFFLIHPGGVAAILVLLPLYDYIFHKRKLLTALFNIGQLLFTLSIVSYLWFRIGSDEGLSILSASVILYALITLTIFSLINHLLTNMVIVLATKKPFLQTGLMNKTALYNELAVITLGLSMAALWTLYPPLAILATAPIAILFLNLIALSKKESALMIRQSELASLNDLALEIGAKLEMRKLSQAIVRIASDSVHASSAILAFEENDEPHMKIYTAYGWKFLEKMPKRFSPPQSILSENAINRGQAPLKRFFPDLSVEEFTQYMALPLSGLKDKKAMLCVFSGIERRGFDHLDAEKLKNLGKFIDIALSNANLYENLKLAQQRLIQSEKLSAVGMLVSGVAHELNSPLTSILGYSDLLYAQSRDDSYRKKLEKIAGEAQRASKIFQNLLTFARESKAEKKLLNINVLIEKVLELKAYSFGSNKIKVIRELYPHLGEILADSNQMHQVLLNIFNNAEHALASKRDEKTISIRTYQKEERIKIMILNNGPMIPEENLKKIFLPFFTTKEIGHGTGLGLSICYGIIKEHRGKITVENSGEGVTFTIELPVFSTHETIKEIPDRSDSRIKPIDELKGKKILLVEDEDAIREYVNKLLSSLNMQIDTSGNGLDAKDRLKKNDYDLILLDIKLPGLSGIDLYRILKKEQPLLLEKIIFMTGDTANENTKRFIQFSSRPCLSKPFTAEELVSTIRNFFIPVSL